MMLLFFLLVGAGIFGLICSWQRIVKVWKRYFTNSINFENEFNWFILQSSSTLYPYFPSDMCFATLQFSAIRHCLLFVIFSFLIYFVNISWLNTALLVIHLLYQGLAVWRQLERKRRLAETGNAEKVFALTLKASAVVAIYSCVLAALLYVVYAIRP